MTGLCTHNPVWDQTRAALAAASGYVLEDDGVLIATDFECGNGHKIRRESDGAYALDLEPEPGEHVFGGAAYYFCFGVRNRRSTVQRVRVRLHGRMPKENSRC